MHEMMRQGTSLTSEDDSEKLQLFFGCRNLADLDLISVTDSFLTIKLCQPNKPQKIIMKTKVYDNNLNPDYAQTVTIQYFFEIRQKLKLEVYHEAKPPQLVGALETSLGEIFGSPQHGFKKDLINSKGKTAGQIIVRCEKVQKSINQFVQFNLQAFDLPMPCSFLCFGSSSDTFYRLYRVRQKDELLIYESEVSTAPMSPKFKTCKISERRLCKNDADRPFQIRFYNHSGMGNHSLIGKIVTTINQIIEPKHHEITDNGKSVKGSAKLDRVRRYIRHSFVDYITAGLQLMLITCIDFTASNGSPSNSSSLHYLTVDKRSRYQEALGQVSSILLDYDWDKLVPVYGFGAKVKMPTFDTYGKVHHCFPLNGNENDAHVFMVEGIMQAYRYAMQFLELSGPTHFSPLLQNAIQEARKLKKQKNQYMIIFILTDGEIHDRQLVIDQIIESCELPISLIIVGIGEGPFDIMEEIDDDGCNLVDSHGRKTTRDLVQFVEFRKFKNSGVELAKEVLEELPRQVEEYYQLVNIAPQHLPRLPPPPPGMNMQYPAM